MSSDMMKMSDDGENHPNVNVKQLEKTVSILKKELIQADRDKWFLIRKLNDMKERLETMNERLQTISTCEKFSVLRDAYEFRYYELKKTNEEMLEEYLKTQLEEDN